MTSRFLIGTLVMTLTFASIVPAAMAQSGPTPNATADVPSSAGKPADAPKEKVHKAKKGHNKKVKASPTDKP
ncbi:MAG: hypothetical protein ABF821_15220 [Gluconacetobacter sp.]|jgi:hypothetical protein|uniref:hypothetical protein n=2 Tax=Acetobacteraceae TaxID=433 RepID=UPI00243246A2|nr:hypothetical protein [Acetobacter fabarum]MCH4024767.1 hypothetical protein [Acetobacter fabarum]MCH4084791.1 hypothetical protein [Acetobacter fabarum]MCH4137966.1 hypothetical protein [Acetobacter fabarum]